MRVFLLHGMGRTPASLALLAWRLRAAGHQPKLFGYTVSLESLDTIRDRFVQCVRATREADAASSQNAGGYAAIGHSLGNLITRYAAAGLPDGLSRFVQMAPPNHPPAAARLLQNNVLFQAVTQDVGRRLSHPEFFSELAIPEVPTLILAGDAGPRFKFGHFEAPNDGILQVTETALPGIPQIILPAMHTFIMNRQDTTRAILSFLQDANADAARVAVGGS